MGNDLCNCGHQYGNSQSKIVLLLVGLDNTGKTTIAKALSGEFVTTSVPTVGFSSVKLSFKGYEVIIYDLGGGPQIRAIWASYYNDVHGIIFVVDASDLKSLQDSKQILQNLLSSPKLSGKPVLVLANKQDKPSFDEIDIVEILALEPLVNKQKCPTLLQICTAVSDIKKIDPKLLHGYRWLINKIISNYVLLNKRVESDMKTEADRINILREKWKKDRLEEEKANEKNGKVNKDSNGEVKSAKKIRKHRIHPETDNKTNGMKRNSLDGLTDKNSITNQFRPSSSKSLQGWGLKDELVVIDKKSDCLPEDIDDFVHIFTKE